MNSDGVRSIVKKRNLNQYFLLKLVAAHHKRLLVNHLIYLQHKLALIRMAIGMMANRKKMMKKEKNDKGDPKVEFYVKVGNHKKFKIF